MTSRAALVDVLQLARAEWLEEAVCRPTDNLIDVTETEADDLVRRLCYRCPSVGPCRDLGERLAPHAFGSLYGARWWAKGERP